MIIASIYPFPFFIGHGHDVNFSLIKDGEIYSCEEGKITATVMDQYNRFPERAMLAGFKEMGVLPEEVDIWVFGNPHHTPVEAALRFFFSEFKTRPYEELQKSGAIRFVDHHLAHATLAVYGSGYEDGMFWTMDDGGDEADRHDSTWGTFQDNDISVQGKSGNLFGLTTFHNFLCDAAGYLGNTDNGKVMGLASYGQVREELYREMRRFLEIAPDGFSARCLLRRDSPSPYRLNKFKMDSYHRYKVIHSPNPPTALRDLTKHYSVPDIAATGQKIFEDVALEIAKNLLKSTGKSRLVCSGGTFQNISLNKRLLELGLDGVYVPSAMNDAGLSLGAALHVHMGMNKDRPKKFLSPYLGPSFSEKEIEALLKENGLAYRKSNDVSAETAKLLAEGKVVGWFQGRSELGPRALGARSVLADPRTMENKARINQLLKRRDWFMPYAPSVPYEDMKSVFKESVESPYMTFAFRVHDAFSDKIQAAVHVDGTSRPSSVRKELHPKYHAVIKEFQSITGVPVVLNTSFNRHGIATIMSPRQAIEHLLNGCMDVLAIENFIVTPERTKIESDAKLYSEKYFILIEELKPFINSILHDDKNFEEATRCNKNFVNIYNISFDPQRKTMMIGDSTIFLEELQNDNLRDSLFPLFEKHENNIWPN